MADVALEIDPATGTFFYDNIILTVQRQAGKTALDQACAIQNVTMGPNRFGWYTAQSGGHATDKFLELADVWEGSPLLKPMARKPRRSNGSAWLKFISPQALGSMYRPYPPTKDGLHGKQVDRDTTDEAWFFSALQGAALKQASVAPKLTRRKVTGHRPQSWLMSTEGTIESEFLNETLDAVRAGGLSERTAFFDWGLFDDDDPMDLDIVAARHPGYGHLFEMEELLSFRDGEFAGQPGEFARAFGNRRTGATERVIPKEAWVRAKLTVDLPPGRVCFGAAYGIDAVDGAILAGQRIGDETVVSVVDDGYAPGTWWLLPRLQELCDRFDAPAAIDKYGPSASLHDDAELAGLTLIPIGSGEVSAASQKLLSGMVAPKDAPDSWKPTWRYKQHPALDAAAELATRRYFGDGAWAFGRRQSVGSIATLEAGNLAAWGIDHMPAVMGMQLG